MLTKILPYLLVVIAAFSCHAQSDKQITIKNARSLEYDETLGIKARRLVGDVVLEHEKTLLYCDSAYLYSDNNIAEAFGNVRIQNQDNLKITSQFLRYMGNTKQAFLEKNVVLNDGTATLNTERLDFNNQTKIAYYTTGATITDNQGSLTSNKGQYHANTRMFYFKEKVTVLHNDLQLNADTLNYQYDSKTAYFVGPTYFKSSRGSGFTQGGYFDNNNKKTLLIGQAQLTDKDYKQLFADTIFFDDNQQNGFAIGCVMLLDTVEKIIINAGKADFDKKIETNIFYQNPMLQQYDKNDTLLLVADTLKNQKIDSLQSIFAWNKVSGKRANLLFSCDSLVYAEKDSTFRFFTQPVMWADSYQLYADSMQLHTKANKLDYLVMTNNCFIGQEVNIKLHNQIKGRQIMAFFEQEELDLLKTTGNAESIYWAQNDEKAFVGATKMEASVILIKMENKEPATITFKPKPKGVMHPMQKIDVSTFILEGFEPKSAAKQNTIDSVQNRLLMYY